MSSFGEVGARGRTGVSGIVLRATVGEKRRPAPATTVLSTEPSPAALSLALAHAIAERLDDGRLDSAADAARRMGVTRARLSQLLRLLDLAPDLQEGVIVGADGMRARALRPLVREVSWERQRALRGEW